MIWACKMVRSCFPIDRLNKLGALDALINEIAEAEELLSTAVSLLTKV
jgi:hypothetical protein